MSDFHDPDLRQQLGRLSGPYPDDNKAFEAWQRRVGQARRRRAMAWTAGAALSLVVGTVGVAALQSPARQTLVPGKSSESSEEVSVSIATTEAEETTVETAAPETSAPDTTVAETTPSTEVEAESSVAETEGTEVAGESQGPSPSKGKGGSPTSAAPNPPQAATQTFSSTGGSIAVRLDGDQLTVVAVNPAAGFHSDETSHSGRRVDVTFKNGNLQFEISVKVVDGAMKATITDKSESHQDSVPEGSSDGGHGNGNDGNP